MAPGSSSTEIVEVIDLNGLRAALTRAEDCFAMAVVEFNGNVRQAYIAVFGDDPLATVKGREMLARPEIRNRVVELQGTAKESVAVTLESHAIELAVIRDMAKTMGAPKIALNAEIARGKVYGLYGTEESSDRPKAAGGHLENLAERLVALQKSATSGVKHAQTVEAENGQ